MPELGQMHTAKLVLLGEMGAGKSSLVLRFVKGQFFDYQVRAKGQGRKLSPSLSSPSLLPCLIADAPPATPTDTSTGIHRGRGVPHQIAAGAQRQV